MKKPIISVSFKENEKEIYNKLMKHSSPASIIKDILKAYYVEKEKPRN